MGEVRARARMVGRTRVADGACRKHRHARRRDRAAGYRRLRAGRDDRATIRHTPNDRGGVVRRVAGDGPGRVARRIAPSGRCPTRRRSCAWDRASSRADAGPLAQRRHDRRRALARIRRPGGRSALLAGWPAGDCRRRASAGRAAGQGGHPSGPAPRACRRWCRRAAFHSSERSRAHGGAPPAPAARQHLLPRGGCGSRDSNHARSRRRHAQPIPIRIQRKTSTNQGILGACRCKP